MRALVTGATGELGAAVASSLERRQVAVAATSRSPVAKPDHVPCDLVTGDLEDLLRRTRPDVIVHAAGARSREELEMQRVFVEGTQRLLAAAAVVVPGARILTVGSSAEYGDGDGSPLSEDDPLRPVTPYGVAKASQTTTALTQSEELGLSTLVVRPFQVVSGGSTRRGALGNISAQLVDQDGPTRTIRCGRLDVVRDYMPLRDAADAVAALAISEHWAYNVINVCTGVGIPLTDLVAAMAAHLGVKTDIEVDPELAALPAAAIVVGDPTRLEQSVGPVVRPTPESIAAVALGL